MKKSKNTAADKLKTALVDELKELSEDSSQEDSTSISASAEDKTAVLGAETSQPQRSEERSPDSHEDSSPDRTILASRPVVSRDADEEVSIKTSFGVQQAPDYDLSTPNNSFAHAEALKYAQSRILDLEKECEKLRRDNDVLGSANEIANQQMDELRAKIQKLENAKAQLKEQNEVELKLFREGLQGKDLEIQKWKNKTEEFEIRFASDLKRIRVKERELENRLELAKSEKTALVRSKDEIILDLKRQLTELESEIAAYKNRIVELNEKIESNQEQFSRTVRALRLALTNLETAENTGTITLAPIKKAE